MKKLNKKGFTIVELVIVIAVIGILSAVLIPTFSNLTEKANESAAIQEATNEYKTFLAENAADSEEMAKVEDGVVFKASNDLYVYFDGEEYTVVEIELVENSEDLYQVKGNPAVVFEQTDYFTVEGNQPTVEFYLVQ